MITPDMMTIATMTKMISKMRYDPCTPLSNSITTPAVYNRVTNTLKNLKIVTGNSYEDPYAST
jgi:hypothetical protein